MRILRRKEKTIDYLARLWYTGSMKYKLIVSDFDGTLLRSDDTVSPATKETIARYIRAGGTFTISTGRSHSSIARRLPDAGLDGLDIPILSLQGSMAVNARTGEELFVRYLDSAVAARFVALCERDGVYCHIYTKYEIFTEKACEQSRYYERMVGVPVQAVGPLSRFMAGRSDFVKILAVCDMADTERLAAKLSVEMGDSAQVFTSSRHFAECIPADSGKGAGLKRAAALLGIDVADVIAVGDEMNDLSMIETAGLGVAVANAREPLRRAAQYVTAANDDDGVRKIIERFCPEVI